MQSIISMTKIQQKINLVKEETSPLFRIMSVSNDENPEKRSFSNNIVAFNIGNGYILSVAHNLRIKNYPNSIPDLFFKKVLKTLNEDQQDAVKSIYQYENLTEQWHANRIDPNAFQNVINILETSSYDFRFTNLYKNKIYKPFLIIQFKSPNFYNDPLLTKRFKPAHIFEEPALSRHTFLIELELVKAFYSNDIAIYKIVNTPKKIIEKLPYLDLDYGIYDKEKEYYCLQSAPLDNLGRLLNGAQIEGHLDTFSTFFDPIGGNYIIEGFRYLIKGYFRFGSSGAPYLTYDEEENKFKVNAIQSEASPIQLSINNNRSGNFQYTNGIATPIIGIKTYLERLLRKK